MRLIAPDDGEAWYRVAKVSMPDSLGRCTLTLERIE
jgi:hypothetical protein